MKLIKCLAFVFLLFTIVSKVEAQDLDNLKAILTEGYTIDELHELSDLITLSNHRSVLEKRGFKFVRNDTEIGSYIYDKNDYVSFYVNYENGKLTSVHFRSSPQKFYGAVADIKNNSAFTYSSEKASGNGKLTYYKYKGHSMSTNDNYYRVTMWPKEPSSGTSSSTSASSSSSSSSSIAPTIENYYSAKEFADAVNPNIKWANIGFSNPSYEFDVKGSMDMDRKSVRFITKSNVLYLQMNIPRNGQCDYGLKEVKAKWTGQSGSGESYFYYTFEFSYQCDPSVYKNVYVYFKRGVPGLTKEGVEAWIRKNAY